jgi:hypothetical protein
LIVREQISLTIGSEQRWQVEIAGAACAGGWLSPGSDSFAPSSQNREG